MLNYQEVLALAATAAAAAYLAWRGWQALRKPYGTLCSGCRCCMSESALSGSASAAKVVDASTTWSAKVSPSKAAVRRAK
jgi:hypothetical protein